MALLALRAPCLRVMVLAGVLIGATAGGAMACTVCISVPEATAADRLLAADTVVLARENPDKPFTYVAVEVLAGEIDTPEIDLFLNTHIRRKLAHQPDRAVILILEGSSPLPPNSGARRFLKPEKTVTTWQSLGFATARYEALVRQILARAPGWRSEAPNRGLDPLGTSPATSDPRVRFFMPYLSDPDQSSRQLAYLEVGRAPYDQIRIADNFVTPADVRAFLADFTFVEWHPFYVLLFGMNATEAEKAEIRALMASRLRFSTTLNLGAWATALIEIDGEKAIDWLDRNYLGKPGRHATAVTEVLKALSVHGTNGRTELRSRIAASYALALETHPNASARAAVDLTIWRDRRFTGVAQEILSKGLRLDPATEFAVSNYASLPGG